MKYLVRACSIATLIFVCVIPLKAQAQVTAQPDGRRGLIVDVSTPEDAIRILGQPSNDKSNQSLRLLMIDKWLEGGKYNQKLFRKLTYTDRWKFFYYPFQPLLGAVCQMCQRALSMPRMKTSNRPSALLFTASKSLTAPPKLAHPLQPLLGAVCQMCHSALSVPRANTSNRPSALLATASTSFMEPPGEPNCSNRCSAPSAKCATKRWPFLVRRLRVGHQHSFQPPADRPRPPA